MQPGVQVVEDFDEEVFFVRNRYWVRRGGHWYRAPGPRARFVHVEPRYVPATLVKMPPGQYVKYKKARHEKPHKHSKRVAATTTTAGAGTTTRATAAIATTTGTTTGRRQREAQALRGSRSGAAGHCSRREQCLGRLSKARLAHAPVLPHLLEPAPRELRADERARARGADRDEERQPARALDLARSRPPARRAPCRPIFCGSTSTNSATRTPSARERVGERLAGLARAPERDLAPRRRADRAARCAHFSATWRASA